MGTIGSFFGGAIAKFIKDKIQTILGWGLLISLLYVVEAHFPEAGRPIRKLIGIVRNFGEELPPTPSGGVPPPEPKKQQPKTRIVQRLCPPGESRGCVRSWFVHVRDDHTRIGRIVTKVEQGDTLELIEEWDEYEPETGIVLFPTSLETEDAVIGLERGEVVKLLGENRTHFVALASDGTSQGTVSKDSVERLGSWLKVRTISCESGWVPSDSIEVLDMQVAVTSPP